MFGSYVQVEPVLSCRSPQNFEIIFHSFNGCVIFTQLLLMCFQAITRPELLTIPGEEHQGTPLHPSQIISHLCIHKTSSAVLTQEGQAHRQLNEHLCMIYIVNMSSETKKKRKKRKEKKKDTLLCSCMD